MHYRRDVVDEGLSIREAAARLVCPIGVAGTRDAVDRP